MRAKQRYYNTVAGGALSNYDEKVLAELALYGLPMLRVTLPITSASPPGERALVARPSSSVLGHSSVVTSTANFSFSYTAHDVAGLGSYYTIGGEEDVHVSGGRPIQPRTSRDVNVPNTIAHGALLVGGTFSDGPVDPLISRVVTEHVYVDTEPSFPVRHWYPVQLGTVNRFLAIDGQSRERLVVVPGQFRATASAVPTATVGTQRLYSELAFEIYHAPFTATDFIAPSIWAVEAISSPIALGFQVQVDDDRGDIQRVVVLYRELDQDSWSKAELRYDPARGWATGSVARARGPIEYFVQAVDPTGNVALALDHGNPFRRMRVIPPLYLPLIAKTGP
jgi:hypothetical protein